MGGVGSSPKPGGVFGLVRQEGEGGEIEADEPLLPGEKIYVRLYSEKDLTTMLTRHGFTVVETKRRPSLYEMEFPYNKLLLIVR